MTQELWAAKLQVATPIQDTSPLAEVNVPMIHSWKTREHLPHHVPLVVQLLNKLLPLVLLQCRSTLRLLLSSRRQHQQLSINNNMGQLFIQLTSLLPKELTVILNMILTRAVKSAATLEATKFGTPIQHLMMTRMS
jgi:hypothetical protein